MAWRERERETKGRWEWKVKVKYFHSKKKLLDSSKINCNLLLPQTYKKEIKEHCMSDIETSFYYISYT
jgi:hypothetical protein